MQILNKLNMLLGEEFNINKIKPCFGKYSNNVVIKKIDTIEDVNVYSAYINNLYNDYYFHIYINNNIIINIDIKESYY